ncbi:lysophospholipid acyltransferase 7-like [Amphibalanus amphitrite]|uniref:lysophospholipid acyltransferase 7-like n=1 Tax=Amphibalanus amphitrite TaxID=1232801 RepID=UPI001C90AA5E|nr:lysophospholipid acyltransferase 7-like [Amphibalanus amphitrite]XP_043208916.1 lysophospholipid acyltransferase 7-like [Amphibalanus amphitrite]
MSVLSPVIDWWTPDASYVTALLVTAGAGPVFRGLGSETARRWFGLSMGLLLLACTCGKGAVHPLAAAVGNVAILKLVSARHVHAVSFAFCFAYLALVRLLDAFVHDVSPLINVIQMLLSLKLVGLAFEVHNSWRLRQKTATPTTPSPTEPSGGEGDARDTSARDRAELAVTEVTVPTAAEQLQYAFFYVGMLTGPYYTYVTFRHCMEGTFWPWADCGWAPVLRRARFLPLYIVLFLFLGWMWPIADASRASSWLYGVWFIYPVFTHFRMRMYFGFILSEVACITHGLGAYPAGSLPRPGKGPTDYGRLVQIMDDKKELATAEYDFETVHNIREGRVELDVTMTSVLKQWNTTVQYWLYYTVYRSTPGTKVFRASVTMLVSAFWHGIHSGYYLSLLTCPLYMVVEDLWERRLRRRLPESRLWLYDCVTWFLRVSMFSYLCMGFLLLRADTTLAYWRSVYFVGHTAAAALYALGLVVLPRPPRPPKPE